MGELKCGSLNFRDAKEFHLDLLNNGPTPVNFRGFILTKEDSLLKAQMDQLRASEEVSHLDATVRGALGP